MRTSFRVAFLCLFLGASLAAVPVIGPPVNQASFEPPSSLTYGIAQGSMFAVFGTEMGPAELVVASAFPLLPELAGTSAQVTVNGETLDCIMVFTSAGQIAAILPSATPLGDGELRVTYNGETSEPQPIRVVANGVGMFTIPQNGQGPAVVTDANFAVNTYINSFAPGTVGIAWVTGLGARTADDRAVPEDLKGVYGIEVFVGGISANVLYAGPSGCCAGVDQVVYEIPSLPEDVRTGCRVPVAVTAGGTISNFTSISLSDDGPVCGDDDQFSKEQVALMHEQGSLRIFNAVVTGFDSIVGPPLESSAAAALSEERGKNLGPKTKWFLQTGEDEMTPQTFHQYLEPARGTCIYLPVIEERNPFEGIYEGTYDATADGETPVHGEVGATGGQPILLPFRPDEVRILLRGAPLHVVERQRNTYLADNWTAWTDATAGDAPLYPVDSWSRSRQYMRRIPLGESLNTLIVVTSTPGGRVYRGYGSCNRSVPGVPLGRAFSAFDQDRRRLQVGANSRVFEPAQLHATGEEQSFFRGQEQFQMSQEFSGDPGETRPATGQSEVTTEGYFVSANANFNDLGFSVAARYSGPPSANGWGLYLPGDDRPLVRGPLPGTGDVFTATRGLDDLRQGGPSWTRVKELIEDGKVSLDLTEESVDFVEPRRFSVGARLRY